jgi:hypothetical protein
MQKGRVIEAVPGPDQQLRGVNKQLPTCHRTRYSKEYANGAGNYPIVMFALNETRYE